MKKILPLLTLLVFAFSSCKKDKCGSVSCGNNGVCDQNTGACKCINNYTGQFCQVAPAQCSTQHTGSVQVNSSHSDAYDIYINNSYKGTQYYGTTTYSNIPSGYVTVQEKQVNYTFFQNTYSQAGTVTDCNAVNANF